MHILFIGDIVGKLGREAVSKVLPELKKRASLDVVFANGENLAHGRGVTPKTVSEVVSLGVDYLTSGNHIFWQKDAPILLEDNAFPLLRPANYPPDTPGKGWAEIAVNGNAGKSGKILLINILGRSFMPGPVSCPFRTVDQILRSQQDEEYSAIVVDFHAEATSEKAAMGWYLDGRVTAVVGTHSHVPSADAWVLPGGTAYVTDAGMTGPRFSVLGVEPEIIIKASKTPGPHRFEWVEEGPAVFNSVLIQVGPKGQALDIKRVDELLD